MKMKIYSEEKQRLKKEFLIIRNKVLSLKKKQSKIFKTSVDTLNFNRSNNIMDINPQFQLNKTPQMTQSQIDEMIQQYKEDNLILDVINLKTVAKLLEKRKPIDTETAGIINKIKACEENEIYLKRQLERMKEKEMDRLFKEFTRDDYERRYNTQRSIVISAMIGEDNMGGELCRQARETRIYYDKLKQCEMFHLEKVIKPLERASKTERKSLIYLTTD